MPPSLTGCTWRGGVPLQCWGLGAEGGILLRKGRAACLCFAIWAGHINIEGGLVSGIAGRAKLILPRVVGKSTHGCSHACFHIHERAGRGRAEQARSSRLGCAGVVDWAALCAVAPCGGPRGAARAGQAGPAETLAQSRAGGLEQSGPSARAHAGVIPQLLRADPWAYDMCINLYIAVPG